HADIVLHEVRDEDGTLHGLASYGRDDWERRAPAVTQVASLTTYAAWHTDANGQAVPITRTLPVGDGTFHWFSHATDGRITAATREGGTRSVDDEAYVDLIEDRLGDATDIMIWSCQTPSPLGRRAALALATRVRKRTGRRAYVAEGDTSLDHDPTTGEASAHT